MSGPGDNNELSEEEAEALLDRLAQAIDDTAAVPPWLTRFAKESHRLVGFEGELAEIVADSLFAESATMRSNAQIRTIEFTSQRITMRLEFDGSTVRGSVDPAAITLEMTAETGVIPIDLNDRGFFSFEPPEGPIRLLARGADYTVRTDWISLR